MNMIGLLTSLDIVGFIFGLCGAILIGRKNKWGFIAFIIGSTAHGIMAYLLVKWGLMSMCAIFILIDAYYFGRWTSERTSHTS